MSHFVLRPRIGHSLVVLGLASKAWKPFFRSGKRTTLMVIVATGCFPAVAQQTAYSEAKAQIDQFWNRKVALCGGIGYVRYVAGDWLAVRNLRWTLSAYNVSQADMLNGVQWAGSSALTGEVSRSWLPGQGWQQWENGMGFGVYVVDISKRGGNWQLTPNYASAISKMLPAKCSDVPPEPRQLTSAEVAAAKAKAAPDLCRQYFSTYLNFGSIKTFMDAGLDPKTCRGSMQTGHSITDQTVVTPLMALAANCISGAMPILLDAGVDINATDPRGKAALDYAIEAFDHQRTASCDESVARLRAAGARQGGPRR